MTNDRDRREFEAGLSKDVDAWLRGDPTRRIFLKRAAQLGLLSGSMLAMSGWAQAAIQLAAAADGRPEYAARASAGGRPQGLDGGADGWIGLSRRAGREAIQRRHAQHDLRKHAAGARAPELLRSRLAGPHRHHLERHLDAAPDQYSKPIAEHIAGSGAYDILDIEPAWIAAMAEGGVIAPIDDFLAKYMPTRPIRTISIRSTGNDDLQGQDLGLLRRR